MRQVINLIWRVHSFKLLHWECLHFTFNEDGGDVWRHTDKGPDGLWRHNYRVSGGGSSFWHYRNYVEDWPDTYHIYPQPGQLLIPPCGGWTYVFMDDMKLCPACQRFHPHRYCVHEDIEAWVNTNITSTHGVTFHDLQFNVNTLGLSHQGVLDLVKDRLAVPEFTYAACGSNGYCEALRHKDKTPDYSDPEVRFR